MTADNPAVPAPASRFRKKPMVIEAVRVTAADYNGFSWDSSPFSAAPSWLLQAITSRTIRVGPSHETDYAVFEIHTLEGVMRAEPGDWIIRGVKGELYPCKPDIFAVTYEPETASASRSEEDHAAWLIWSREHKAWWRAARWGYTDSIDVAGRYTEAEADQCCETSSKMQDGSDPKIKVRAPEATVLSRDSEEDHAPFDDLLVELQIRATPGSWTEQAHKVISEYAALLSRDSGEAVKLVERMRKYAGRFDKIDKESHGDTIRSWAADVLSLSASAARLAEDNKRLRKIVDAAQLVYDDAVARCIGSPFQSPVAWQFLNPLGDLLQALSPAASPPEGQTHKIVPGGPPCPTCGFRIRIEERKPFVFDDDEGGKAPADGAEGK